MVERYVVLDVHGLFMITATTYLGSNENDTVTNSLINRTPTIFTPDFELMLGTKGKKSAPKPNKDPVEVQEIAVTAGE